MEEIFSQDMKRIYTCAWTRKVAVNFVLVTTQVDCASRLMNIQRVTAPCSKDDYDVHFRIKDTKSF